jgi:hypothetical protein
MRENGFTVENILKRTLALPQKKTGQVEIRG